MAVTAMEAGKYAAVEVPAAITMEQCCPGTVTDPSGAIIPGAVVTATRTATGVSQSTFTSGAGTYMRT